MTDGARRRRGARGRRTRKPRSTTAFMVGRSKGDHSRSSGVHAGAIGLPAGVSRSPVSGNIRFGMGDSPRLPATEMFALDRERQGSTPRASSSHRMKLEDAPERLPDFSIGREAFKIVMTP